MTFPYEELTTTEQAAYDAALAEQIDDEELTWQVGNQDEED